MSNESHLFSLSSLCMTGSYLSLGLFINDIFTFLMKWVTSFFPR